MTFLDIQEASVPESPAVECVSLGERRCQTAHLRCSVHFLPVGLGESFYNAHI